jgi:hypothetical protein
VEAAAPASPTPAVEREAVPAAEVSGETQRAAGVGADSGGAQCAVIGPLDTAAEAADLAQAAAAGALSARVEGAAVTETRGFIVVTPVQDSAEAASALAESIRGRGIHDTIAVLAGTHANRVSLGVYAHRTFADRRREALAALGVAAEVLERTHTREGWWVHARLPAGHEAGALRRLVTSGLAARQRACGAGAVRRAQLPEAPGDAS